MPPPTAPSQVRADLAVVTTAALAEVEVVTAAADTPSQIRSTLFALTPVLVTEYGEAAAALALDWYEEIRTATSALGLYVPTPVVNVREDHLASTVAWATESLYDLERQTPRTTLEDDAESLLAESVDEAMSRLLPELQKEVAAAFRDTMTENAKSDPAAVGWQRFAQADACKLCLMLAGRGAVYTEATARFAAHTNCNCVVGPSFDPNAPQASVLQYVASKRQRTAKERADLRKYLNSQFPDAPG